ncbi:MAG: asparagine synthase C-terminal domain-containing protein [Candidatus Roizmanbacteria bacterium]|nr:asparagine synthase C-terminal domain-containing protein [Candidatus Roizmanbacteria bacterium]
MNLNEYIKQADSIVSNHCMRYRALFPQCGVLLSGGIDSSVITSYVLEHFKETLILSMGTDLSKDKPFVDIVTTHFKTSYEWVYLSEKEIYESLPIVKKLLDENEIEATEMQQSLAVGYYLIFKRAQSKGIKGIVTGQGPDILFAGYHKYKGMSGEALADEIKKDLILLETDKKRDSAMARHFGITLLNPYLEQDFVDFSLTVPVELKLTNGVEKYFMRKWGEKRGLPQEIVNRPKKAFQYSTGLQKKVHKQLE